MKKLTLLTGIFITSYTTLAHAQLYDYASEQAYGRRVEHGAAYRQDGAPCVTVLPARGAMFAFRLRREKNTVTPQDNGRPLSDSRL